MGGVCRWVVYVGGWYNIITDTQAILATALQYSYFGSSQIIGIIIILI